MSVLIVLFVAFGISLLVIRVRRHEYRVAQSARIGMSVMLLFTALGHFMFVEGMSMMIPDFIPFKIAMVYLTGLIEIAAAIGLLIPKFRELTAWLLIVFFVLILPSNIKEGVEHINLYKANYTGAGLEYLWFRIPLQLFFIIWVYLSSIRKWNIQHANKLSLTV